MFIVTNRFHVLQHVCCDFDSSHSAQELGVSEPEVYHPSRGQIHGSDNADFQRSEECKRLPFLGTSLQPQLAVQENIFLYTKKNIENNITDDTACLS